MRYCTLESCDKTLFQKGFCRSHYMKNWRYGSPYGGDTPHHLSATELMTYYGWTVTKLECWEFNGPKNGGGYGRVTLNGARAIASRVAYELWVGPIPESLLIRHKCDNPPCINPEHLETGTIKSNSEDMVERGRSTYGEHHPGSFLTENDVVDIRSEYAKGVCTENMLAEVFGVVRQTVNSVVNYRTWSYLREQALENVS